MSDEKRPDDPEFYTTDKVKPEDDVNLQEVLAKKTGVYVCIPNMGSMVSTPLIHFVATLSFRSIDPECPYLFKVSMPNDLTPVEYARNQCVKEFLKDSYYQKLWFLDADMVPPGNWMDMLAHDEAMVSAMTYIWTGERLDDQGYYVPPIMKINAFRYRPQTRDFISLIPQETGEAMYVDATGCASLIIKREVLLDVPEPWFRVPRDPYGASLRSEDLEFTRIATQRGHKLLYLPKVQFGHIKTIDLRQVLNYGLASMRGAIDRMKTNIPEEFTKGMPNIRFAGEKPPEPPKAPANLELLKGGKAI